MKRKMLWVVLIAAMAIIGVTLMAHKNTGETIITPAKVKIAYLPVVQGLPLYVAIEKGYFKEAGLDVEPIKFEAPNQIIDALLSGQADFGAPGTASGITAISQAKKPNSLKIFAVIGGGSNIVNDELLVKPDSQLTSIADLKGKNLGILPGIQFRTIAKEILTKNGLVPDKDIMIVELAVPLQIQALSSGQVDALLTIEPVGTIGKAKGLAKDLIKSPMVQYISDPWYGAVGDVSTDYLEKEPETARKVIAVFAKTIDEINSNSNEMKQYLKNYTPLDETLISQVPLPVFKMYAGLTDIDNAALQKFFDIFVANNVIENGVLVEDLLYK
ncbi:MAG: ABC transporter substrate-binding protein [Patescibacteria group bacterium]